MSSETAPRAVDAVTPAARRVTFGAPAIGEEEIAEVIDTLRSGWIGTGPKTRLFEARFAERVGARHAVATNSGTAALHLALLGAGVRPGSHVITTPLTFVATANVIEHCGAIPVFVDVRPDDGNIDVDAVGAAVTDLTAAILPVHYAGRTADVAELVRRHPHIPVVADAAHAIEATDEDGRPSGAGGALVTAYSFYATKNLTTGEGGMLVTDDEALARLARVRGLHGLDADAWRRYVSGRFGTYDLLSPGFKYNMADVQASLGLPQLARLAQFHERRAEVWERYNEAFADLPHTTIPPTALRGDARSVHARHLYALWIDWASLGLTRGELVTRLADDGVGTGWHFAAVHLQRYYRETYGYAPGDYPVAESIAERTVSLPLSPALSDEDVDYVIDRVWAAIGGP